MLDFFPLVRPFLHRMDPELAHRLTIAALKSGAPAGCPALCPADSSDPRLHISVWGKSFANPVGLAAGFDKNAEAVAPLLKLGFGFVEAGTVTPKPQEGNPRPRIFRDREYQAVINRMGFPGGGLETFRHNLERFFEKGARPPGIVGVNIGMNKDQKDPALDYCALVRVLAPYADYLAVNISSPNTPGLRDLQKRPAFLELTGRILEERDRSCAGADRTPLLVKLAPDLSGEQQQELAEAALESGIDGLILTNTTLSRPNGLPQAFAAQQGGLSGRPLGESSTEILRNFYRLTGGKIPLIGVGGITSAQDAYAKIRAGASLVQLYSGLVFKGPKLIYDILQALPALLEKDGYATLADAVGADHAGSGHAGSG